MNRKTGSTGSSGVTVGRLFMGTALVAIVFSVGLILGQRLLLEENRAPVVSSADESSDAPADQAEDTAPEKKGASPELFSFYDVLTAPEVQQLTTVGPRRDEIIDTESEAGGGVEDAEVFASGAHPDSLRHGDFDFDDAEPQTDDGIRPARFTLQIASHASMEQARTEMDRLRRLDLEPHLVAVDVEGHGKYYRVRVGKFPTENSARSQGAKLANDHDLRAFVTPL